MEHNPGAADAKWTGQIEDLKRYPSYQDAVGLDGEAIEFEWNICPGFSSLQILQENQNNLQKRNIKPEEFTDWIIFMSVLNDIDWTRKGNDGIRISNSENVKEHSKRFSQGHWTFLGPGKEVVWSSSLYT